ncbi:conserved membrane protein of unknown function [Nitrospira japonica]|uniref:Uncharacterized protein n=1 Tax=Nitrospira japonica TaxID=1325564 RepID=A0A1W1I9M6_9BACT|nr:hypothetical protein [Nitrospira japonica]SLM49685.1 conserved membrane protein of unknown function [Nitrospira japonica]
MPKLVTVWRKDDILSQAKHYVRSYILLPSGILGLVCMLGGIGGLGYQFVTGGSYTWNTFVASSGLLILGGLCGAAQTVYHRHLLSTVPEVFAARMRAIVSRPGKKGKADPQHEEVRHTGRALVPFAYVIGAGSLFAGSIWAFQSGWVEAIPAVLMPWAGFYWGKLLLWRGIVH